MTINRDYYGNPSVPGPPGGGVNLPPVDKLGVSMEGVNAALEEAKGYEAQLSEAVGDLKAAEKELEEAKTADTRAYADAIRAGKKAPGRDAVQKAEDKVRETERRIEALQIARNESVAEAQRLVAEKRPEWREESSGALDKASERFKAAISELEAARGDYHEAHSLTRWLQDSSGRYRPRGGTSEIPTGAQHPAGGLQTVGGDVIFGKLREESEVHIREREKREQEANAPQVEMKQGQPQRLVHPGQVGGPS